MAMFILICIILICIYLYLLKPNRYRGEKMDPFRKVFIAHRGLFDNKTDAPENSLAAFQKAVAAGYGIELDVQMTTDGKLVVFHDESLKRICGVDRILHRCTYEELQQYHLAESQEKISLFEDVLKIIGGKVPLIMEIKSEGDWKMTTKLAAEKMDSYEGLYCMESFHPLSVAWYRRHRPDVIRGQLSSDYFKDGSTQPFFKKFVLSNLLMNFRARPDFIAYNHLYKNQFSYKLLRKLFKVVNVAWTIRSEKQLREAEDVFEVMIFDSFIPAEKTPSRFS